MSYVYLSAAYLAFATASWAADGQTPDAPKPAPIQLPALAPSFSETTARVSLPHTIPHSDNPIDAYRAASVPKPNLSNSMRLDTLVHNGVIDLSLDNAIALALENNLDLAIARYNIPIALADVLRTQAGGFFRGVNTGVVQNTPGGGVDGFGSASSGAGAGGTTGGAGGAGTGASGLVQSTLGTGTVVASYDPAIIGTVSYNDATTPLSNNVIYGVPSLHNKTITGNIGVTEAFATGTALSVTFNNDRITTNSPFIFLNPELDTLFNFTVQQQLLAGFGLGPNLRYLRIARNNRRISDEAFELQVITTVTQIADIYWDLVAAYEDEQVKNSSLDFANQTLSNGRKQLALHAVPALDVMKDEAEVAIREQELTIARTKLQFQQLLIKNAITRNLDDPILEAMPVRPVGVDIGSDMAVPLSTEANGLDAIAEALSHRVELTESIIDLQNRDISRKAADNALLPTLALIANYGGTGLAGPSNPLSTITSTTPPGFGGSLSGAFNNTSPDYYVGFSLNIPLRNRVAKSDQYRSELETRQAELRLQQLKKEIRIEVRNAQYALVQAQARVAAAVKGRDLAQKSFEITNQEQQLGAGSGFQTLTARRDLAEAESALVAARTAYQKARIELDRSLGNTLESFSISIESARTGVLYASHPN